MGCTFPPFHSGFWLEFFLNIVCVCSDSACRRLLGYFRSNASRQMMIVFGLSCCCCCHGISLFIKISMCIRPIHLACLPGHIQMHLASCKEKIHIGEFVSLSRCWSWTELHRVVVQNRGAQQPIPKVHTNKNNIKMERRRGCGEEEIHPRDGMCKTESHTNEWTESATERPASALLLHLHLSLSSEDDNQSHFILSSRCNRTTVWWCWEQAAREKVRRRRWGWRWWWSPYKCLRYINHKVGWE